MRLPVCLFCSCSWLLFFHQNNKRYLRVNLHVALVSETILEAVHDLVDSLFEETPGRVDIAAVGWWLTRQVL